MKCENKKNQASISRPKRWYPGSILKVNFIFTSYYWKSNWNLDLNVRKGPFLFFLWCNQVGGLGKWPGWPSLVELVVKWFWSGFKEGGFICFMGSDQITWTTRFLSNIVVGMDGGEKKNKSDKRVKTSTSREAKVVPRLNKCRVAEVLRHQRLVWCGAIPATRHRDTSWRQ